MCFLKDMILQKQPHIRLFLQYTLFGQLLLIEFLNLGNHVLNFLVYLQKIGIQDTFFSFYRREFIETLIIGVYLLFSYLPTSHTTVHALPILGVIRDMPPSALFSKLSIYTCGFYALAIRLLQAKDVSYWQGDNSRPTPYVFFQLLLPLGISPSVAATCKFF